MFQINENDVDGAIDKLILCQKLSSIANAFAYNLVKIIACHDTRLIIFISAVQMINMVHRMNVQLKFVLFQVHTDLPEENLYICHHILITNVVFLRTGLFLIHWGNFIQFSTNKKVEGRWTVKIYISFGLDSLQPVLLLMYLLVSSTIRYGAQDISCAIPTTCSGLKTKFPYEICHSLWKEWFKRKSMWTIVWVVVDSVSSRYSNIT